MFAVNGDVEIGGSFAYVPQTPWIQNATVQENILFGSAMNSQRYYKVCVGNGCGFVWRGFCLLTNENLQAVSSCQLTKDMEALAAGDQTEVCDEIFSILFFLLSCKPIMYIVFDAFRK